MELLDVVDGLGRPTGKTVTRDAAHRDGVRHRTSHVWLLRCRPGGVELLLQKRSAQKDSFPGCYDISSAGHIPAGQGFIESALRELWEELGVLAEAEDLIFLGQRSFCFQAEFHGRPFCDRQVSNVYALWYDAPESAFALQKEEVEAVCWTPLEQCRQMVRTGTPANCLWAEELEMVAAQAAKKALQGEPGQPGPQK